MIMKRLHSEESKLTKGSFTGCCWSTNNKKAASHDVKGHYIKSLNAFRVYWQAVLHNAYNTMTKHHNVTLDFSSKDAFVNQFR